jgi:hypothetical protein
MKRPHFSFSRPEPVPYLISSSQGNHEVFLGSLISSRSSGSSDHTNRDEDEPSSTYSIPLQRWIDQACGYTFMQDDQVMVSISNRISSLPPISMSFILRLIIYLFMLMIILCWTYLCCFT